MSAKEKEKKEDKKRTQVTINDIKAGIRQFNEKQINLVVDDFTREVFSLPWDRYSIGKKVVTISRIWGALSSPVEQERLKNLIYANKKNILDSFRMLHDKTWQNLDPDDPQIENLWNWIMGDGKQGAIFFSKFLHWNLPNLFPIMDKNAKGNLEFDVKSKNNLDIYKQFIQKYKLLIEDIIRQNGDQILKELIEYDLKTQQYVLGNDLEIKKGNHPELVKPNTILRVLDKFLWTKNPPKIQNNQKINATA